MFQEVHFLKDGDLDNLEALKIADNYIVLQNNFKRYLKGDNSNTDVNTTDWTCAVGEAFQISQGLPSTSTYLLGAYLILTDV